MIGRTFILSRSWIFLILVNFIAFVAEVNLHAQSCGSHDDDENAGKIIERESLAISESITGYSEYTYKGVWYSGAEYKAGESVLHNGVFWKATFDNSGQAPMPNSSNWSKGDGIKYREEVYKVSYGLDWLQSFWECYGDCDSAWMYEQGSVETSDYKRTSTYEYNEEIDEIELNEVCSGSGEQIDLGYLLWTFTFLPECGDVKYTFDGGESFGYKCESINCGDFNPPKDNPDPDYYDQWNYNKTESEESKSYKKTQNLSTGASWLSLSCYDCDKTETKTSVASQTVSKTLSKPDDYVAVLNAKLGNLDAEEDWTSGGDVAYLGDWSEEEDSFHFSGTIVRYWAEFSCLPKNPKLECTYWVWPIGGNEETDGKEELETASPKESDIEETEDGRKKVKAFIIPKDGYNKRLVKIRHIPPCDAGSNGGNSNGAGLQSAMWWVSLGDDDKGVGVGNLRLKEAVLDVLSATPQRLKYDGGYHPSVAVIKGGNGEVRQVKTSEVLADVVALDGYSYEIRFYWAEDVEMEYETISAGDPLDPSYVEQSIPKGLYKTEALPFSVWKVENPDGAAAHNRLKITHLVGQGNEEYLFEVGPTGVWNLSQGMGLKIEERHETVLLNGDIEVIHIIKEGGGTVTSKVKRVSRFFPFGKRDIEKVVDPDGAALLTAWQYYSNASVDGKAYGQIKQVEYSDGSWERYEYDDEGRESKVVRPWLDGGVSSPESSSRVTATSYSVVSGEKTATIIEKIMGQEVGRRYWVRSADGSQIKNVVCTEVGAAINAGSNLITITEEIVSGEFKGKTTKVSNSDGTLTTYGYVRDGLSGELTTTMRQGEPNVAGTSVVAGREIITVEDAKELLLSRTERDITSNVVIESMTVTDRDEFGRGTEILYGDGTTEEKSYDCCGVESETDRQGMTTNYTYDALKRVSTETRAGITTFYTYDASGRVLTKTRRGTDSSDIVVENNVYNLAGRLISRKNALNHITTYDEAVNGSGQTVRTTTLPDNSTQIEISHRDGQLKEVSGSASHPAKYEYGVDSNGEVFTKEIRIGEGSSESEWIKTHRDIAGRTTKVEYPGEAEETYHYNSAGQLVKQVDPDGVARLYAYNAEGEQSEVAIDADENSIISSGDRRIKTLRSVISGPLIRNVTQEGTASGYETTTTVDASPNGRYRKETRYGLETVTEITYASNGDSTQVTTYPDGSTSTTESENGQQVAVERKASGGAVIASTTYEYDPHGRLKKQTDGRVGTETVYTYNNADQITEVNAGGMITSYTLNNLGQIILETLPGSGRSITKGYLPTGEIIEETGSAAYPVTYTYDPQGRRRTMVTSSGTTTWSYHNGRGWLASKADAANEAVTYTYTDGGKLKTRTWARGIVTTYGYNGAGELDSTTYSDGTPSISITYNERGRPEEITDASGTRTLTYTSSGQLEDETISGGSLDGVEVEAGYDSLLRRDSLSASRGATELVNTTYTFDGASRLATVTSGSNSATYNYVAGSSLVGEIGFKHGSSTAMTTVKTYDNLNRLKSISSAPSVGDPASYVYDYNSAGQRERVTLQNEDIWNYGYNDRGEVISGGKKQGGSTDLLGYQFGYDYDNIGNRLTSTKSSRTTTYQPNSLNQYTGRTVPGYLDIIGEAKTTATVTVNGTSATRQGKAYYKELSADNSEGPVYLTTTVKGELDDDEAERAGKLYLAPNEEAYTYDKDGNLKSDGRWIYQWNGENRLVEMETQSSAMAAGVPKKRLTFAYDYQGRRISKKVEDWKLSRYEERYTMLFVYNGWNLIAETLQTGPKIRSYVWGNDLSGGNAAGGVGGLLFIGQYPENKNYAAGYDGSGNVTGLFEMESNGEQKATYEYGPFGEPLIVAGSYARINPIRGGTKYVGKEDGLIYYGYRFYNPITGRWISRDPIEENDHSNLYAFVGNNAVSHIDGFGLLTLNHDFVYAKSFLAASSVQASVDYANKVLSKIFSNVKISGRIIPVADYFERPQFLFFTKTFYMRNIPGSPGSDYPGDSLSYLNRYVTSNNPILIVESATSIPAQAMVFYGSGIIIKSQGKGVQLEGRLIVHELLAHYYSGKSHGKVSGNWDNLGITKAGMLNESDEVLSCEVADFFDEKEWGVERKNVIPDRFPRRK